MERVVATKIIIVQIIQRIAYLTWKQLVVDKVTIIGIG